MLAACFLTDVFVKFKRIFSRARWLLHGSNFLDPRSKHLSKPFPPHHAYSPRSDGRCAHPGCTARLDRFKLDLKRKHFCGICDRTYCSEHTCWVSHGPMSRCDLESKCICFGCYPLLPDNHPARKRGTGRRMPKSPSVPNDMSYGPDAHLAGEALPTVGERTPSMTPALEQSGRSTVAANPGGLATPAAGRGTKNGAPPEPSDETRGRRNWRKGRVKILAAIKFKLGPKKAHRDDPGGPGGGGQ